MSIKDITGVRGPAPIDASRTRGEAHKQRGSEETSKASASDQVTLTSVGRYLATAANQPAPVNQSRVEQLRAALADGSYQADSKAIASKLLRMDLDLI